MSLIIRWLLNAVVILLVAYIVPGFHVVNFFTALIIAVVLAVINITLKPLLIVLTLPVTILTLGLFIFVINGFVLWFTSTIIKGFTIDSFMSAFVAALLMSLIHYFINRLESSANVA